MDIFVIPSRSEGFPLAMLEAASASKAIVSSDIPVFKEFFNDKEVCKFRLDDIPSLVSAIKETVAHKSEYGQNAKARFEHDYSPDCFYYSHLKIYTCPN